MTRPRIVDPGATLALSRRTTRRHFLLHPDEARQMEQVYWYCLAYAAKLHGVLVHAACLMSTHSHEVVTDVRGEYPKFLQTLHRNLALCTKAYRGYLLKECALEDLVVAIHTVAAGQIYVSAGLADTVLEGYGANGSESSALNLLTPREREVLQLLAEGHPAQDIASRLKVSVKTVGTHREHLMQKLDTHSLAGLTKFAIREGVTLLEE